MRSRTKKGFASFALNSLDEQSLYSWRDGAKHRLSYSSHLNDGAAHLKLPAQISKFPGVSCLFEPIEATRVPLFEEYIRQSTGIVDAYFPKVLELSLNQAIVAETKIGRR